MLAIMILNEKEKEALVIEFLNKVHTSREIAKMAHVPFTLFKRIKAKITERLIKMKRKSHCPFLQGPSNCFGRASNRIEENSPNSL